jgi:hypothetical protein
LDNRDVCLSIYSKEATWYSWSYQKHWEKCKYAIKIKSLLTPEREALILKWAQELCLQETYLDDCSGDLDLISCLAITARVFHEEMSLLSQTCVIEQVPDLKSQLTVIKAWFGDSEGTNATAQGGPMHTLKFE